MRREIRQPGVQRRQRVGPHRLVARLAGLLHLGEPDDPGPVDDERAPVGEAGVVVEHAVGLATAPCGQKSDSTGNVNPLSVAQTLCVGGGPTEIASVCGVVVLVVRQVVPDLVELALADTGERQREEHQQHVLARRGSRSA